MQIGLIGLGKMGYNLALNMQRNGFKVVAFDISGSAMQKIAEYGIATAPSIAELCRMLSGRRVIWMMVPAGNAVDVILSTLRSHLSPNDIVIDGGNSHYKDSQLRARELEKINVHFLDCGTSGGPNGALHGACTTVGGNSEAFQHCTALFRAISVSGGCLYTGKSGSGHFTKMIHNGIEYGMLQSIAEGMEVLRHQYPELDLASVARAWNHGSVVRGWLMEMTERVLQREENMESIRGVMNSSGEGKWTVEAALEMGIPAPSITMALLMRYRSQMDDTFSGKLVATLRNEVGGHGVERKG
jgi:6-phosphogluconate dehydrogenase